MRSLFWRILAAFWLALLLVAGLSILLGRALNQDTWIIARYPGLHDLARQWTVLYETRGPEAAQSLLDTRRQQYELSVQVLDESGQRLVNGTYLPRPPRPHGGFDRESLPRFPWRQLSQEYTSSRTEQTYLFIYRIPHPALQAWHRGSLLWPLSALGIALVVLTVFSLLLTLSITRPLNRLRRAVHDLGQTSYQQDSLARLSRRGDELGVLARDFNRMGARLQRLIGSQRQLLRDVSHELRSPLARLRIALALAERAEPEQRAAMWPRLEQECDRLEALIGEILALARLDADPGPASRIELLPLLERLRGDAQLLGPEQHITLDVSPELGLDGWQDMLERALDNLLRNALRFNPADKPLEIRARPDGERLHIDIRDHGPGASEEHLAHLGEPFFRAPNQSSPGHGLGLAIARRAIERHGGRLRLGNHPDGGFLASIDLPMHRQIG
ncbi:HAMP domain-containing histidine kinase [Pseudomonas sp. ZM23]|uniref:histidine kinase n=1 Tax=Pseudomonas triclosanedens TaxID=2961893 RepID=A0ABY6ZT29_9PSED|nr:HAMP domain-containing sensor histidine kinase [Pseudomonas triclosanedens]MCP8466544.1 HAMP domain-containing histidine kinase [Pseudomonas triclosanedens]MCP8472101.1 HAMP domain-containing histidine kinase [Pseudomonas triclosanedens]MCP8474515.1 HAMP domain-containing histidine kinase [Pseudomonas triclosanedens]WAI48102.1 HAMP domain-containing sensor histidine kinase [Pseudomonas triclosanedens]